MDKPNEIESVLPHSGRYSLKTDARLNAWLAVAVLVYIAGLYLLKHHRDWSPPARGFVALAPLLPSLLYVRSWARFIGGMDELQRRIQLEVFLFAALGTVFCAVVADTLNASGVGLGLLPHGLGLGGAFVTMLVLWLAGTGAAIHRYQ